MHHCEYGVILMDDNNSSGITKHTSSFQIADWVVNGTGYDLIIPATAHGRGTDPVSVTLWDKTTGECIVEGHKIERNTNGDVIINIEAPATRFNGNVVVI